MVDNLKSCQNTKIYFPYFEEAAIVDTINITVSSIQRPDRKNFSKKAIDSLWSNTFYITNSFMHFEISYTQYFLCKTIIKFQILKQFLGRNNSYKQQQFIQIILKMNCYNLRYFVFYSIYYLITCRKFPENLRLSCKQSHKENEDVLLVNLKQYMFFKLKSCLRRIALSIVSIALIRFDASINHTSHEKNKENGRVLLLLWDEQRTGILLDVNSSGPR